MKIETRKFGTLDVAHEQTVKFIQPIIGFPGFTQYVVINTGQTVSWLQSLEDASIAFPIVNPFNVMPDYDIEIPTLEAEALQLNGAQDAELWTVTVLAENASDVRTNLRTPIVINRRNGLAKQVVLSDNRLPLKYYFAVEAETSNKEVAHAGVDT